jgi:hypothetical protein
MRLLLARSDRPGGHAAEGGPRRAARAALAVFLAASLLSLGALEQVAAAQRGAKHKSAKRHSVHEVYRTGVSHPLRYFAEVRHDRSGRATIVYYRRYATAPGYFQSFVRNHERCHLSGHGNEIAASCCALERMRLSQGGVAAVRNYIIAKDVNSETVVDYKGQGQLFWSKIERRCPGAAGRRSR